MDFQLDESCNFTSLLQQNIQANVNISPEMTPNGATEGNSVGKRGKNFSAAEDKLILSAWLNTSLDPLDGNNMKGDRFWGRVERYFNQWKQPEWPPRTISSINHRWGAIQLAVNKFCGFLTQVENWHRSGVSNEDNIQEARKLYLGVVGGAFCFDHCWVLLKDEEKWKKRDELPAIKRKKSKVVKPSYIATQETINLGDDSDEPSKANNGERPEGRKGAKARKKAFGDVSVILSNLKDEKEKTRAEKIEKMNVSNEHKSEFLQQAREANRIRQEKLQMQSRVENEKSRIQNEKSRVENEKLQLERDKEDTNIMMKDLSSMDSQQQEYFKMRRLEILSRKSGNS